jgi:hypothetical protein
MENWGFAQYLMAGLFLLGLMSDAHRHGRPYQKTENVFVSLVAVAISATILHFGGFW